MWRIQRSDGSYFGLYPNWRSALESALFAYSLTGLRWQVRRVGVPTYRWSTPIVGKVRVPWAVLYRHH